MNSDRWRLVSPHLDQALDLSGEERRRYLEGLASEDPTLAEDLERLLGEDRALREECYLEHDAQDLLGGSQLAGQAFGAYTLERPLGAGGMGSVWLARRNDGRFEGTVAIKLLSPALLGAAGASRFRREGTILARLKHPNIAHLTDAGVSGAGQPYLVLEYVEGQPIDRWCDERGFDVRARVRLFLDVLAAVAHAHANLVIHRDLKPSNVMVSKEGQVKLLDFGIAKLLEGDADGGGALTQLTRDAARVFTPAFAAPEQVTGESVTTATDVYALGALLYLLLAGRHPIGQPGASPVDLLRGILETEPGRLSEGIQDPRVRRELGGDLEIIVAKALKKNPRERYASVAALGEDLRRYLAEEPIRARPDSLAYRTRKLLRRRARSLAAAALALCSLAAVVAFYGARLAEERDRAKQVSVFLTDLLSQADPYVADAGEPTVRSLLDAGAGRAREDLAAQPDLQREMLTLLGRIYQRRGAYDQALPLLERAVSLGRRTLGPSRELAQSLNDLGVVRCEKADLDAARVALEEALAMRRKILGVEHPEAAISHSELGRVLFDQGRLKEAEAHFRAALKIRRKVLGPDDHETATSMSDLGHLLRLKGDRAGAEALFRETLAVTRKSSGPKHPNVATGLANLALTLTERGDLQAAEALFHEGLAIGRASLGREHPGVARQEVGLSRVYLAQGRPAAAEPLLRHALEVQRRSYAAGDWRLGDTQSLLGEVFTRQARFAEAEPCLLRAAEILQAPPGAETRQALEGRDNLARLVKLYEAWGQPEKAARYR